MNGRSTLIRHERDSVRLLAGIVTATIAILGIAAAVLLVHIVKANS